MFAARSADFPDLIDSIYEAAFNPERWVEVLSEVGRASGSASGLLMIFDGPQPVHFRATPVVHAIAEAAAKTLDRPNERAAYALKNPYRGFVCLSDYFPPHLLTQDPGHGRRLAAGLDSEASSVVYMPTGELVVFSFDRWERDGPHRSEDLAALNGFYPHLARTALIAARLGLERATTATNTLQMIGLPAAALTKSGRVVATNGLFDRMTDLFLPSAFGRLALADARAQRMLEAALQPDQTAIRSIPIAEARGRAACVLHVLPLRRTAYDVFGGADMLVAATSLKSSKASPSSSVLESLFDFTHSEVTFAASLMRGATVREASIECGVTEKSGRTYLARLFAKTGTHRQSELLALLASAHPFEGRG